MFRELGEYTRAGEAFQAALDLHPHYENAEQALQSIQRFGVGQTL